MLTYARDTATDAANRDLENTYAGTAAWNAQDDSVVMFLREDTTTYTGVCGLKLLVYEADVLTRGHYDVYRCMRP
jgi:hypothetical protein